MLGWGRKDQKENGKLIFLSEDHNILVVMPWGTQASYYSKHEFSWVLLNLFSRIWEMGKLSATGVSLSCTNGLHCLGEVTSLGAEGFV